jgi:hypothetical protein
MSRFRIGRPAAGGGGFNKDDHLDHLLGFVEPQAEEVSTSFGEAVAARCSYIFCCDDATVDSDVLLFGSVIAPRLCEAEDEVVAGRLTKGLAKPGRSAPWLLDDPTDDDLDAVEAFLEANATRLPSGKIVMEAPRKPGDPERF